NLIFRISCNSSVRLIGHLLQVTMTTGQITCYKSGQLESSRHKVGAGETAQTASAIIAAYNFGHETARGACPRAWLGQR
ncbi:MAG: hypothetical protein ACYCVW_13245, partial [Rhodocyclaceae bacterium]